MNCLWASLSAARAFASSAFRAILAFDYSALNLASSALRCVFALASSVCADSIFSIAFDSASLATDCLSAVLAAYSAIASFLAFSLVGFYLVSKVAGNGMFELNGSPRLTGLAPR